jgi:hypothetical protein
MSYKVDRNRKRAISASTHLTESTHTQLPRRALAVCPGVLRRLNDRQRTAGGHWAGRPRPG